MVHCAVPKCENYSGMKKEKERILAFHRIPQVNFKSEWLLERSKKRQSAWLARIKKNGLTETEISRLRICSDHFVSGAPSSFFADQHVDWVPSLNLGYDVEESDDFETGDVGADCQLTESQQLTSPTQVTTVLKPSNHVSPPSSSIPAASTLSKPSNHVSPSGCSISVVSTPLKPNQQKNLPGGAGGVPSLKRRTLSVSVCSHVSSDVLHNLCDTSNSPLELSPVKLSRVSTPNTKCYKRQQRKNELSESEWSSDSKKSDVRTEQNTSSFTVDTSEEERVCLKKKDFEDLVEYKLKYEEQFAKSKKLRDTVTDLEVDKLELQEKLKSAEEAMENMKGLVSTMKEDIKEKKDGQTAKINKNYQGILLRSEKEFEKIKQDAMKANALTFRKLEVFSSSDAKVKFYTGIRSYNSFSWTLELVLKHAFKDKLMNKCLLEPWQSMLMTLMRLRLGLLLQDLAYRFGVSLTTAGGTFDEWLDALYKVVCPLVCPTLINWPHRETLQDKMPKAFQLVCKKYRIVNTIPAKLLKSRNGDNVTQNEKILKVACALTNLKPSIAPCLDNDPSSGSEEDLQ
ncbi:uncharacterized protein LOC117649233 [Thrips palmi]|uniref:Uncharacterized protein LOC117649233 n=1 Tax=Thrips palmi TaxID=161013 RepID=A0A6P8ZAC2_THRPL|nr:uncharacterized protein LOC117649233 [Thrips palmi]